MGNGHRPMILKNESGLETGQVEKNTHGQDVGKCKFVLVFLALILIPIWFGNQTASRPGIIRTVEAPDSAIGRGGLELVVAGAVEGEERQWQKWGWTRHTSSLPPVISS